MAGSDWLNKNVFSCRRKEETDGADCTSSGRVFQKMEPTTGNERRPAVDRRYGGMCSCSVNDDRRWRRPGRLDTGTSWFRHGDTKPSTLLRHHETVSLTSHNFRKISCTALCGIQRVWQSIMDVGWGSGERSGQIEWTIFNKTNRFARNKSANRFESRIGMHYTAYCAVYEP